MPVKNLKVGFFEVVVTNPETAVSFDSILRRLHGIPNDESRTAMFIADEPVRLRFLNRATHNRWLGDVARIRLHEDLQKSTTAGHEDSIVMAEDEGLLEKTAFLYSPHTRVVAIQQSSGAVTVSSFGRYFKTLGAVGKIELRPVLKMEALERLLQMGTVQKLQVRFAGIDSGRPLTGVGLSARQMLQSLRALRAPKASISISIDRETTTLQHIGQFVQDALRLDRDGRVKVEKILVVGSEGDAGADEISVIDLMEDRAVQVVPVDVANIRRVTDHDRYNAVTTAWNRQYP